MDMPQLKMKRSLREIPVARLAPGYELRRMQPGEEAAWAAVLNSARDLGEWNEERALHSFEGQGRVWREAVHLVWLGDEAVGTTCVQLHDDTPDEPELGWVAVLPAHQGKGLGAAVCAEVLGFLKANGHDRCYLGTDDHRLPAIKSYLNLGFRPYMEHESYPDRWRAICGKLGVDLDEVGQA